LNPNGTRRKNAIHDVEGNNGLDWGPQNISTHEKVENKVIVRKPISPSSRKTLSISMACWKGIYQGGSQHSNCKSESCAGNGKKRNHLPERYLQVTFAR
jgi:hypothetical protein